MTFSKGNVKRWMSTNSHNYRDSITGEINMTALAEGACDSFGKNDVGGPLDQPTHWVWDLAAQVNSPTK